MDEKKLEALTRFLEASKDDSVKAGEFANVVEALLRVMKDFRLQLENHVTNTLQTLPFEALEARMVGLVNNEDGVTRAQIKDLSTRLSEEIKRLRATIPEMPDLSEYELQLADLDSKINALLDTPEEIRDKLEKLKDDERLDISAIKGIDKSHTTLSDAIINRAIGIVDQRTSFLINKVSNLRADVDAIIVNPGLAIGDSIGSATEGSVLFAGPGGVLAQDSTNFSWDNTANRLTVLNLTATNAPTLSAFTSNGGPLYTNGSGVVAQVTAGTATQVLHGGSTPTFGAVVLTTDVSGILPVANGGSGTSTAFTQGSVVFAGASGVYTQDNTNFFWNDTDNQLLLGNGTAALPAYSFGLDPDTGMYRVGTNIMAFSTGGAEKMRLTGSQVLINVTTARAIGASTAQFEIEGTSANASSFSIARNSNDGSGSIISLGKSRGTAIGDITAVQSGDALGVISFSGADGTNLASRAAQISAEASGTISTGVVPGVLKFQVTNSSGTLTDRMRITSAGLVGINAAIPVSLLDISTNTAFSGTPTANASYFGVGTNGAIYTDTATAGSGTAGAFKVAVIGQVSLAATNSPVTTTLVAGLTVQGAPRAHTNQTITTTVGLDVLSSNSVANAGTVGTAVGLRVAAPTGATTNYTFITSGAGFSSFGSATPASFLSVAPNATVSVLPTVVGTFFSVGTAGRQLQDNTTAAAGTLASAAFTSFEQGIFAATNAITEATEVSNVIIAGPPRGGTNGAINNAIGLLIRSTNSLTNATTPTNGFGLVVTQTTGATNNYTARFDIGTATSTTNNITLKSARAALVATNVVAGIGFMSDDTSLTAPGTNVGSIRVIVTETHTASALGSDMRFSVTANGTTAPLEALRLVGASTAVNNIQITNSATGANPTIGVTGTDSNIGIDHQASGTGTYRFLGTSSQAAELRLYEDTDLGTNYSAFKVGSQSGDITYTLPTAAPTADGAMLTSTTAGVMSWSGVLSGSATLDFGSTAAGASTDLTITVTGAALGDMVALGTPNGSVTANGVFWAWVSATDTVTVRYTNTNLVAAADPASGTFKVKVFK